MQAPQIILAVIAASVHGVGSAQCTVPDRSFESFLERFKNDQAFQRSRAGWPIPVTEVWSYDDENLFPVERTETHFRTHAFFAPPPRTLIVSNAQASELNVEFAVLETALDTRKVFLGPVRGEADAIYYFARERGCWDLVRVELHYGAT